MRHPMVRKNVDPAEIVRMMKETIDNFHLETDNRFFYQITEKGNSLRFEVTLK